MRAASDAGFGLGIDVYQMTTLIAHAAEGRLSDAEPLAMSFFFRRLPKNRNYVVTAGLRSIVEHCRALRFRDAELTTLDGHPVIGPALRSEPGKKVRAALQAVDGFVGEIDALPEGTLAFAGPAQDAAGRPIVVCGVPIIAYTPMIQVRTSMVLAKLIETPWLSRLNYFSMVASKAARIVTAARTGGRDRAVLEFGQRRTHPDAAVDASYAAYLAGCGGTSNLLATHRYGIPSLGTMDHFAVQAAERLGVSVQETERGFFRRFCQLFPHAATLLVDTYDTFAGIEGAVRCARPEDGDSVRCSGVRLDSNVTAETVRRARALLDSLGGQAVSIFVSDGLDEWRVRELAQAGADGFGVGENITCSPDAATGIGAVGKLVVNGYGKLTMKLSVGSSKATLPGLLQVYRFADHDLLTLAEEPPPRDGTPLLVPLWRGRELLRPLPELPASRALVAAQLSALPPHLAALEPVAPDKAWPIRLSAPLFAVVEDLVRAAVAEGAKREQP
jgi:nicotinate phosphoribosyltransferase